MSIEELVGMSIAFATPIVLYAGIGGGYVVLAWKAHVRAGLTALVVVWVASAAVYGYLRYRYTCSQPLTCDVIGPGWTWYYFSHLAPVYGLVALLALGVPTLMVHRWHRSAVELSAWEIMLGACASFFGWFVASIGLGAIGLPSY